MEKNLPADPHTSPGRSHLHVSLTKSGLTVTGEHALAVIGAVCVVVAVLATVVVIHLM